MTNSKSFWMASGASIAYAFLTLSSPARAQESAQLEERVEAGPASTNVIIVTARKRDESLLEVPVIVSALSGDELTQRGITNLDGISRSVPQLLIGGSANSTQGGTVTIRGVSGPDILSLADQAVAFNIDGVQVARSTVRRMTETDIAQVEVLRGPQALFYGKNSPGGIITIRSRDPGAYFEAAASAGYEVNAHEFRGEGFLSGPVSETLGVRVAGIVSSMDGWMKDVTPADNPLKSKYDRNPDSTDFSFRGTAKWKPAPSFDATLKLNYGETNSNGVAGTTAYISCNPDGRRLQAGLPCSASDKNTVTQTGILPETPMANPRSDGEPFAKQNQLLSSLNMSADLSDQFKLSSITGYYKTHLDLCGNVLGDALIAVPVCQQLKIKEFSQELRLASNLNGIFNFVAGGLYGTGDISSYSTSYLLFAATPTSPIPLNTYLIEQDGSAYSFYGQAILTPSDQFELDLGGRYSHETKKLPAAYISPDPNEILNSPLTLRTNRRSFNDFSPEITASWRPHSRMTVFGSYKKGFLSGGFNVPTSAIVCTDDLSCPENSYDQQVIKGFEGGVKLETADGRLRGSLAAYSYKVTGMQLSTFIGLVNITQNAGKARVRGLEGELNYQTPMDGLKLRSTAAYNQAKYIDYSTAPCWPGQTISQGCTINTLGVTTQDLGGQSLPRAPKWNLSGGFTFDTPVTDRLTAVLASDVRWSSGFFTDLSNDPLGRQPSYTLLDASLTLKSNDDAWEAAIIGRNLTDTYYYTISVADPFTGSGTGTTNGVTGDRIAGLSRGRELLLRIMYRFGR